MRLPVIRGVIDRRILVNYRVDPAVLARVLPPPFRPLTVAGHGIAGICLIRLREVRPRGLPAVLGVGSENAAHRVAVEWTEDGRTREGVYIPRRDTSSRMNALAGGRLFPGEYHRARFEVEEGAGALRVSLASDDGETRVEVRARRADALPATSVFGSLEAASAFFERGAVGYSATREAGRFDGMELRTRVWEVEPLAVESVASSFFDDPDRFPPGSITLDCALLMRQVPHEWHGREPLAADAAAPAPPVSPLVPT